MARPRDFGAEYRRRIAHGVARGHSRAAAAGHARRGEEPISRLVRVWSDVPTTAGLTDVVTVGGRQASVLGRYEHDVGALARGLLTPAQFSRQWAGPRGRVNDVQLESDSRRVLAQVREAAAARTERYRRGGR